LCLGENNVDLSQFLFVTKKSNQVSYIALYN